MGAARERPARGACVELDGLSKRFAAVAAADNVSLSVERGEFLAILGPSGSGKTTVLLAIAGLLDIDAGDIRIEGRSIVALPTHKRGIGIVFQGYALFPHLTVFENVAFPLRQRNMRGRALAARVGETLALVQLDGLAGRYPSELSGGQQQRVAIARAIVFSPSLLLMDEPLAALDRRLRQEMQIELKLLQRKIGTTVLLVTHDQEEAMSLADRIAVIDHGSLQQVGAPSEVYDRPANAFVAGFIGETNRLAGRIVRQAGSEIAVTLERLPGMVLPCAHVAGRDFDMETAVVCFVRPEALHLREPGQAIGRVVAVAPLGDSEIVVVRVEDVELKVKRARLPSERQLEPGEAVPVSFPPRAESVFPAETAAPR